MVQIEFYAVGCWVLRQKDVFSIYNFSSPMVVSISKKSKYVYAWYGQ